MRRFPPPLGGRARGTHGRQPERRIGRDRPRTRLSPPGLVGRSWHAASEDPGGVLAILDALTAKSDCSFMLVPGGTLRTEVSASELQEAIADLYERLVLEEADSAEMKIAGESAF